MTSETNFNAFSWENFARQHSNDAQNDGEMGVSVAVQLAADATNDDGPARRW